jgi:NAD(P)-dependent dehydrogenase (short-subunit alcohol dehydrogenase family)
MLANAVRALMSGARQGSVQGDALQLGGTLVVKPDGSVTYSYRSREAGDHAPISEVLAALDSHYVSDRSKRSGTAPLLSRMASRVLDPTIVWSFDRTGYFIHELGFDPSALDVGLDGKHAVITGANSGLGLAAARALAALGARVTLLCRNEQRAEQAVSRIIRETRNTNVTFRRVDLSDLDSIRSVGQELRCDVVDILIHNAGLLPDERLETADGLELTFATHVIGPHVLTDMLVGAFERADQGRVVWVSSGGMYTRRLSLDDTQWLDRDYDGVVAYAETKRAQVVLSEIWSERLRSRGIQVNAMHPGWADTPGVARSLPGFQRVMRPFLRDADQGADTAVWLAASVAAGEHTGKFFFDRQERSTHLLPFTRETEDERDALLKLCDSFILPRTEMAYAEEESVAQELMSSPGVHALKAV